MFSRMGYAATTNKQIAEHAGVTAAAIYLYFDSKVALYMATVNAANDEIIRAYRKSIPDESSIQEAFSSLLTTSLRLHERDPFLTAFLSSLPVEMRRHEEVARAMSVEPSEILTIIHDVVDTGVSRGEITSAAAPGVVSMFVACTIGFSLFVASIDGSRLAEIVDSFNALLAGSLFRKPTRTPTRRRNPRPSRE